MTPISERESEKITDLPTMGLVRRLVQEYLAGHVGTLLVAAVAMVLVAGATAAYAWLMQPLLDDILLNKDRSMLIVVPFAVFDGSHRPTDCRRNAIQIVRPPDARGLGLFP